MGQAGSSQGSAAQDDPSSSPQQHQQQHHHQLTQSQSSSGRQSEGNHNHNPSRSPSKLRSNLAYSRSLRRGGGRDGPNASGSGSSSNPTANDASIGDGVGGGGTGGKPPRRKSLDMPDMSLKMTANGTVTATPSALPTPSLLSSYNSSPRQNSKQVGPGYPYPGQVVAGVDENGVGQHATDMGIPMAAAPLLPHPSSSGGVGIGGTSSQVSSASAYPGAPPSATGSGSRWGRAKNKEGLVKKAQPVTGSAAALHALAFQNTPASSPGPAGASSSSSSTSSPIAPFRPGVPQVQLMTHHLPALDTTSATPSPSSGTSGTVGARPALSTLQSSLLDYITSPISPPTAHPSSLGSLSLAAFGGSSSGGSIPPPMPSPLKQPTETILAPLLPPSMSMSMIVPPLAAAAAAHDLVVPSLAAGLYVSDELAALGGLQGSSAASSHPASRAGSGNVTPAGEATPQNILPSPVQSGSTGMGMGTTAGMLDSLLRNSGSFPSPLLPGSTPPLGNPPNTLPAAAPIAALNPSLARDPKAKEAMKAATVDLGAGPDGVVTLLTWKGAEEAAAAGEGEIGAVFSSQEQEEEDPDNPEGVRDPVEQGEASDLVPAAGTSPSSSARRVKSVRSGSASTGRSGSSSAKGKGPEQVFVTGTFAKGWGTKIQLRRKETEDHQQTNDFTALVNLPPGPHSLKFIVDRQWKTSKYLPSATDADGNLINYVQIQKEDQILEQQDKLQQAVEAASAAAAAAAAAAIAAAAVPSPSPTGTAGTSAPPGKSKSPSPASGAITGLGVAGASTTTGGHLTLPNSIDPLHYYYLHQQQQQALVDEQYAAAQAKEEAEELEEGVAWTSEIPEVLTAYGDATEAALDLQEAQERALAEKQGNLHSHHGGTSSLPLIPLPNFAHPSSSPYAGGSSPGGASSNPDANMQAINNHPAMLALNRKPLSQLQNVQPPTLPAQLERGVLNSTVLVAKGSGDDNSLLPKPDHSVLHHLAASPIKGGLLSVGVTTRYRRKYVTTVYYKKPVV